MRLAVTGLCVGLVASIGLTRLLASLLFGVTERDPATFSIVALLVSAVAFLGVLIPVRRAAALDPVTALRCE
jgi:ABC-type antimicrobial peptide transport system permease subunit